MHIHIAMMGKVTEPVTKAFQALGFDKLYLLSGTKFQESVEKVTEALSVFNVEVVPEYISGFDFQEIVNTIYHIYERENGKGVEFSINITGGTNLMAAAACSCAFFIGATIYYVMDDDKPVKEQVLSIPTPKTPNMAALKPETREILRYILKKVEGGGYATTVELMEEFDKTKQTLNHQIKILRDEGLVENGDIRRADGKIDRRYRSIVLTQQGRLVASWI
jgi:DNA-binding transcriptional ArsR family regulator